MWLVVSGHGTGGLAAEPPHFAVEASAAAEAAALGRRLEQRQLLAGHFPLHAHQGNERRS